MPSASPPVFKQKVKGRAQKAVRRIIGWHPTSLFPVSISSTFFLLFKCKWTMHDLNSIQFRILLFVNVVIALLIIDRVRSLTAHFLSWSLTGLCVSSTCHSLRLSSAMDRITVYYYYYCINNYWTITACQLPHSWYLIHYYKYPSYSIHVFMRRSAHMWSTWQGLRLSSAMDRITVYYYYYCIINNWTVTECQLAIRWGLIHYYKYTSYSIHVFMSWSAHRSVCVEHVTRPLPLLHYGQNPRLLLLLLH